MDTCLFITTVVLAGKNIGVSNNTDQGSLRLSLNDAALIPVVKAMTH